MRRLLQGTLAFAIATFAICASAQTYDRIFGYGAEAPDVPPNDTEAARFLTQATFGPTRSGIDRVRALGYNAWLDEQIGGTVPTLALPHVEVLTDSQFSGNNSTNDINQNRRMDRWFHTAVYAPDQLRQRVAYALSQILVVSDRPDNLNQDADGISNYNDILVTQAFGNYRLLLERITYTPQMGKYLSTLRNRSAYQSGNPANTILPDENYAREIMQLFSFGLIKRNNDFSPALLAGQVQPTYNQDVIVQLARVFTGLTYTGATTFFNGTPQPQQPASYQPMICMDRIPPQLTQDVHDRAAKTIFDAQVLPARPFSAADNGAACRADVTAVLDLIANHPTVGPFISRQLIQRLVKSNPSGAYVQRVAQVFNNNGASVRGDLAAVVRAILLDPEARASVVRAAGSGKVKEPLLKLTAFWRAFDVVAPASRNEPICTLVNPTTCTGSPVVVPYIPMGIASPERNYVQRPLGAISVFNFYEPDFQQPGQVANASLFSPEFQILNEVTTATMANDLRTRAFSFVGMTNPPFDRPLIELAPLVALATTPTNPDALIEATNQRLLNGLMSAEMRTALRGFMTHAAITGMTPVNRVAELLHMVALSPEFAVQL